MAGHDPTDGGLRRPPVGQVDDLVVGVERGRDTVEEHRRAAGTLDGLSHGRAET